jgi:hypothetical protein
MQNGQMVKIAKFCNEKKHLDEEKKEEKIASPQQ